MARWQLSPTGIQLFGRHHLASHSLRRFAEQAVRGSGMSLEETRSLLRMYEEGLSGYTYLERS